MAHYFSIAPWPPAVWLYTLLPFAIIAATAYLLIRLKTKIGLYIAAVAILPTTLILLVALLLVPYGYRISQQDIQIQRAINKITIPLADIHSITLADKVAPSLRVAASGGFGGYFGRFILGGKEVGIYASRLEQVLLIETGRDTYILSPARPDEFLRALEEGRGRP